MDTAAEEGEDDGDAVLAKCESIAERLRSAATGGAAAAWRHGQLGGNESGLVTLEQVCPASVPLPCHIVKLFARSSTGSCERSQPQ